MYYKHVEDLNKGELLVIYDNLEGKTYPPKIPISDKESICHNILALDKDFFVKNRKFVFEKSADGQFVRYFPQYQEDCQNQKFAQARYKIDTEKILASRNVENLDALITSLKIENESVSGSELSNDSPADSADETVIQDGQEAPKPRKQKVKTEKTEPKDVPRFQNDRKFASHIPNKQFEPKISRSSNLKVKPPRYDASIPIPAWLKNLEIYARCSNLSSSEIITVALTSLLNESEGSHIIQSLESEDMKDWGRFKDRLTCMLGKNTDFYKSEFKQYQRGSDSFGMAVSKLISLYKQGYDLTNLSENDRSIIIERFCESQNNKMKELLMREKSQLTLENIAKRAAEIEASIPKKEINFSIQAEDDEKARFRELVNKLYQKLDQSQSKHPKPGSKRSKRPKIDIEKLKGHCFSYTKYNRCKFAENCKYIHSDKVPADVLDYVKKQE